MKTARIDWTETNTGVDEEDEIQIYRSTAPFDLNTLPPLLATLAPNSMEYDDRTVVSGVYYYGIVLVKAGETSLLTLVSIDVGPPVSAFDPTTLFANGEVGIIVDPSTPSTIFSDAAATVPAIANTDNIGAITDLAGGVHSFIQATAGSQPAYNSDGTHYWIEPTNDFMRIPGSSSSFKFLHDDSGAEVIIGLRAGLTENVNDIFSIIDTCNVSSSSIGSSIFYDDRNSLPRSNEIHHLVTTGGGTANNPVDRGLPDAVKAMKDCVTGVLFQDENGNDNAILSDFAQSYGGRNVTAISSNSTFDLTLMRRASSNDFFFDGRIYFILIINRVLTQDERNDVVAFIKQKMPQTQSENTLFSFSAGSRTEWFVDKSNIESSVNVSFDVQSPKPYVEGPVSEVNGLNSATWDFDKYYPTMVLKDGLFEVWQGCFDDVGAHSGITYSTSLDGRSWTKPDLNIVNYEGSTANNLVNTGYDPTVIWDGTQYIVQLGVGPGNAGIEQGNCFIYTSPDGISLTQQMELNPSYYSEHHGLGLRDDGRLISYYTRDHSLDRRRIGTFISDTTNYAGTWTDNGVFLFGFSDTDQIYNFNPTPIHGVFYAIACRFDDKTERIWMDLYTSPSSDGLTWTVQKGCWIGNTEFGSYDGGMVDGKNITDDGNELRAYYFASNKNHIQSLPRDSRLAYASLPSGRLGTVKGTLGEVTTTEFTPTEPLLINSISSGGAISVEILDPISDTVVSGFSKTDCDVLDGDHKALEVTWGGVGIPLGVSAKLKFYIDF